MLWPYQQSSALVPIAKVSGLRRRHGERVTVAGDCLAAYFDVDGSRGWSPVVLATAKPPATSGFAEDAQITSYVRAVSFGWADVHLSAHRCACCSAVFVEFSHLAGILPVWH